jgi:hypothetical protein
MCVKMWYMDGMDYYWLNLLWSARMYKTFLCIL